MKTMQWKLDQSSIKGEQKIEDSQLFINYLNGACRSTYKDGLNHQFMKRLFSIIDKVEKDKTGKIELEDAEFELIEESFEKSKFDPSMSKIVVQIYNAIEAAKQASKKEK